MLPLCNACYFLLINLWSVMQVCYNEVSSNAGGEKFMLLPLLFHLTKKERKICIVLVSFGEQLFLKLTFSPSTALTTLPLKPSSVLLSHTQTQDFQAKIHHCVEKLFFYDISKLWNNLLKMEVVVLRFLEVHDRWAGTYIYAYLGLNELGNV